MVRTLDSGASGPGSSPGWGHCVVFLGKNILSLLCCILGQDTLLSQCLSPPRCINGYRQIVGETYQIAGK